MLGYLRNQRKPGRQLVGDIDSIHRRPGDAQRRARWPARHVRHRSASTRRPPSASSPTGCEPGAPSSAATLMGELDSIRLPAATEESARLSQSALYGLLDAIRRQESTYKSAGLSVHGCALFAPSELLMFCVEDVEPPQRHRGHHRWLGCGWNGVRTGPTRVFYTTPDDWTSEEGRPKSAQMGVPIVAPRSGIDADGPRGGRAPRPGAQRPAPLNRHFICYFFAASICFDAAEPGAGHRHSDVAVAAARRARRRRQHLHLFATGATLPLLVAEHDCCSTFASAHAAQDARRPGRFSPVSAPARAPSPRATILCKRWRVSPGSLP